VKTVTRGDLVTLAAAAGLVAAAAVVACASG